MEIPRQQMVQWVEKIACLLLGLYHLIFEEMQAAWILHRFFDSSVGGASALTSVLVWLASGKGEEQAQAEEGG